MTSFTLRPTSIFLPKFVSNRHTLRSFWSKSELSVRGFIKKGAHQAETAGRQSWSGRIMAFSSGDGDQKRRIIHQAVLIGGDDQELRVVNNGGLFEATFNRLSKWLVVGILCAIFIWRHDGEAMWLLTGSVLNTILINVLKRVLNQDRPVSSVKLDPGMPSSHAQSIFFAAAYVAVSMVEWLGVNGLTLILSSLVFAIGSYLSWLRVSQQFHTMSQVVVGGMLGSALSVVWFWSWGAVVHEAYICHLWVRVCIALGTAGFCLGFIAYAIHHSPRLRTLEHVYNS
ncbi:unnamed protein product [Rhodiola kirilowii]